MDRRIGLPLAFLERGVDLELRAMHVDVVWREVLGVPRPFVAPAAEPKHDGDPLRLP
jgi:hypothetical protein